MNKILLSPEAKNDLKEIRRYIAEELENPDAAGNTLKNITKRIRTLEDFPKSGALLSSIIGFETSYRFLVCGGYLVFYRIHGEAVFVDRVLYEKRDYLRILFDVRNSIKQP